MPRKRSYKHSLGGYTRSRFYGGKNLKMKENISSPTNQRDLKIPLYTHSKESLNCDGGIPSRHSQWEAGLGKVL